MESTFRERLGTFYRSLQITPPYHSVEKAVLALREALGDLQEPALVNLRGDEQALGGLYAGVIKTSGLAQKHRGIIAGLLSRNPDRLPVECQPFARVFVSSTADGSKTSNARPQP